MTVLDQILKVATPIGKIGQKNSSGLDRGRERIIEALKNALVLIDDPTYVAKQGEATRKPYKCFAIHGERAEVWLAYGRQPVPIRDGMIGFSVPTFDLKNTINLLITGVAEGEFDEQLRKAMSASPRRGRPPKQNDLAPLNDDSSAAMDRIRSA